MVDMTVADALSVTIVGVVTTFCFENFGLFTLVSCVIY